MVKLSQTLPQDFAGLPDDVEYYLSNYLGIRINRPIPVAADRTWRPQTDMFETEEEITVVMEIAGIGEKDINIRLDRDFLIVSGVRQEIHGHFKKRQYHKMEIDYGPFERIVKLPVRVKNDSSQAQIKNGFLIITLKKDNEPETRLEIEIE